MEKNTLLETNLLKKILFTILFLGIISFIPHYSKAASDTSIVIQPSKTEITASPGQKLVRNFSIINRSNFNVTLKLSVKDYKQISDDGKLQFYDSATEPASSWLVPQFLQIGLKPLETKDISFVVTVPEDFSAGGHYGAILFQNINDLQNMSKTNFGELVLLTVTGSGIETNAIAKTINFWTNGIQQGNPVDFNFKIQNTGNTQFESQASLVLNNWLGKEIGSFNVGQLLVYPGTSRIFQWRWNGTPKIGIFQANVMLSDPSLANNLKRVDGSWFVIFPWQAVLFIIILGIVVFAVIRYREKIYELLKEIVKIHKQNLKIRIKDLLKEKNIFTFFIK